MIVWAILATVAAAAWTLITIGANQVRPGRGVIGRSLVVVVWVLTALVWLAWFAERADRLCTTAAGVCF